MGRRERGKEGGRGREREEGEGRRKGVRGREVRGREG